MSRPAEFGDFVGHAMLDIGTIGSKRRALPRSDIDLHAEVGGGRFELRSKVSSRQRAFAQARRARAAFSGFTLTCTLGTRSAFRQGGPLKSRTIKRLPGTGIFEVRYAGGIDYVYRIETVDAVEQLLAREALTGLLINYTSAWPEPQRNPRAVSEFGSRLGRLPFKAGTRVALVNAPAAVGTQTIAVGGPNGLVIRQFLDREQAIAWLTE